MTEIGDMLLWILFKTHSHFKSIAMTNNELLHASLLDILFDGRNKDYGAYSLRKNYNQRLIISLGIGASLILLFILLNSFKWENSKAISKPPEKEKYVLTTIELPDDPPKPETPQPKPPEPVAAAKLVAPTIVPDNEADDLMNSQDDLKGKQVSTVDMDGKIFDNTVMEKVIAPPEISIKPVVKEVVKPSSAPEFPGGFDALKKFLSRNLNTPTELQAGDTKMVKAKFVVDKDGSVSTIEIMLSAGNNYDKEVMRVCKKMPRWKPAIQNGEAVTMSYILPVTFMGIE